MVPGIFILLNESKLLKIVIPEILINVKYFLKIGIQAISYYYGSLHPAGIIADK